MFSSFIHYYTYYNVNYAQFAGRSSKDEYSAFMAFLIIIGCFMTVTLKLLLTLVTGYSCEIHNTIIHNLRFIICIIPLMALASRRLHDLNISGWWTLLLLVTAFLGERLPLISLAIFMGILIIGTFKGNVGPNQFGDDPLEMDTDN